MKTKNEIVRCECCGQVIVDYCTTMTHRNAIWLASLSFLSKKAVDTEGYVHYSDVHKFVESKFGFVVSSYGSMGKHPWNLIIPAEKTEKYRSNGYWKLSVSGEMFLHNEIAIAEKGFFNHDACYKTEGNVFISDLIKCTFSELVEKYKSF